jgi:hypothetical protein
MDLSLVLWALFAFQLKHFLCDFVLQTKFQVDTKRIYGHYGGFIHAGLHGLGTLPVLFIMGTPTNLLVLIVLGEILLHYHVDWLKAQVDGWTGWTEKDQAYWAVFGTDQLIHQLTYLGMVAYLAGRL